MPNPLITPPREKTVTLLPGDYQDRLHALGQEIDHLEAEAKSDKRKRAKVDELARQLDALREVENIEGAVVVTLRAIPEVRKRQIQDDCPPRKGNKRDDAYGFNEDDYFRTLVRECMVTPEVTEEQFDEWYTSVAPADWRKVRDAAVDLCERELSIPKSSAVSLLRQQRAAESKQQRGTE